MRSFLKDKNMKGVFVVEVVFAILLLIILNAVHLYHDDYGYASLSYAIVEPGVDGTNYTMVQWANYLWQHYLCHGGRIVFQGLEALLLKNGAWPMRIVEVISLVGTFSLIHRIANKNSVKWYTMLFCCALYGVFSLQHYRTGFYWFSASVLYCVPLVFVFGTIACIRRLDKKRTRPMLLLAILCAFLAGVSQEQIAFVIVGFLALMCFVEEEHICLNPIKVIKKYPYRLALFLVSFVAAGILMLAPGNFARAKSALSSNHLERIWSNIKDVLSFYFSPSAIFFTIAFIAFLITMTYVLSKKGVISTIHLPVTCAASSIVLAWCIIPGVHTSSTPFISQGIFTLYLMAYVAYSIFLIIRYLWYIKDMIILMLFLSGVFCQFSMLLYSPYIVARMTIVFYMVMFVLFTQLFSSLCPHFQHEVSLSQRKKMSSVILACILIALLVLSVSNSAYIAVGYYSNHNFILNMDSTLKDISAKLKAGEEVTVPEFDWIPNPEYSGDFGDGTEFYMHEYYDLPEDFPIKYPLWVENS